MRTVDVCIATFRRPELLAGLLDALAAQVLDAGTAVRLVVVDNDRAASARAVVDAFRRRSPFEIVYDVEPEQSISHARNRALGHVTSEHFAFVDDDEIVPPAWLGTMLGAAEDLGADVVFGPVARLFPSDAPGWARAHSVFRRVRCATGTPVRFGGAGNVLVRTAALGAPPQSFDAEYGLTGGEDTEFFFRLHQAGRRLIWCDDAVLEEIVPMSRLELRWVWRRSYRCGQSFFRICLGRSSGSRKFLWAARKAVELVGATVLAAVARPFSYRAYTNLSAAAFRCAGHLSAYVSRRYCKEYDAARS